MECPLPEAEVRLGFWTKLGFHKERISQPWCLEWNFICFLKHKTIYFAYKASSGHYEAKTNKALSGG